MDGRKLRVGARACTTRSTRTAGPVRLLPTCRRIRAGRSSRRGYSKASPLRNLQRKPGASSGGLLLARPGRLVAPDLARAGRVKGGEAGGARTLDVTGRGQVAPGWPRSGKTHRGGSTPLRPPSWPTTGPPPPAIASTSERATTPGSTPAPGVVARTRPGALSGPVSGTMVSHTACSGEPPGYRLPRNVNDAAGVTAPERASRRRAGRRDGPPSAPRGWGRLPGCSRRGWRVPVPVQTPAIEEGPPLDGYDGAVAKR
jgi:hypothetical protein